METKLLIFGILFVIAGITFCALSFFLKLKNQGDTKGVLSVSYGIFFVAGALTLVMGILALVFRPYLSARAAGIGALVYLVLLTLLMLVFLLMTREK